MQRAALRVFLLLAALRGARAGIGGETCRRWLAGTPVPVAAFLCPDAQFCCGTCLGTFCCASLAARLDQRECFRGAPDGAPLAPEPEVVYIVIPLVVAITLALGCFALVLYVVIRCCVRAFKRQQAPTPATVAYLCPAISPEDPLRQPALGLPPSYCLCETPVPPYSVEDPLRNWGLFPPSPGEPVVEFRHASPGAPGDGAVTLFPLGGPSGRGCVWEHPGEPAE